MAQPAGLALGGGDPRLRSARGGPTAKNLHDPRWIPSFAHFVP